MDNQITDAAIKAHLREIRQRLDNAASIARAAEACSEAATWTRLSISQTTSSNRSTK